MSTKSYVCLMEDGEVRLLKRKPDDTQANRMHGWCEVQRTPKNAKVYLRLAELCL